MNVKVKKLHPLAVLPSYSKKDDAGMDLTAVSKVYDEHGNVSYGIGLAFEIPDGHVGLLFPRSSNSKQDLLLSNSVGVLDSGYRGEVMFKFKPSLYFAENGGESFSGDGYQSINNHGLPHDLMPDDYNIGDRIGQIIIMPYPQITFEEVDELSSTDRGQGGFGSTGA